MGEFALAATLALLTHYFAVFLLAPMIVWLLWRQRVRAWVGVVPPVLAGVALIPLIVVAGGTRDAVDWRMGAREQVGSDPAVLPHWVQRIDARSRS